MSEQERRLKPTSYYSYRKSSDKHLVKNFKNMPINQIGRQQINKTLAYLNSLKVTARHKNKLLSILKSFFKFCIINYETEHLWVDSIEPFRDKVAIKKRKKKSYYTEKEFKKFLTGITTEVEKTLFTVLFYSGLRISELRALTWQDWNYKKKSLEVNKQLSSKIFNGDQLFTPKTKSSKRTVFIPDIANESLKSLESTADKRTSFIFNISETEIQRRNKRIAEKASIERINLHGFRHSYATFMVKNGINANILQKQLGHSDIKITLKYYVHFELDDQSKEVNRIFKELK